MTTGDVGSEPRAVGGVQLGARAEEKAIGSENKGIEI